MSANSEDTSNRRRQRMGKDPLASLGFGTTTEETSNKAEGSNRHHDAATSNVDQDEPQRSPTDITQPYTTESNAPQPQHEQMMQNTSQPAHQGSDKAAKKRVSFVLPLELVEQARDAAHWVPGVTITALVEQGLYDEIERLKNEYNDGESFSRREVPLKRGRPVSR